MHTNSHLHKTHCVHMHNSGKKLTVPYMWIKIALLKNEDLVIIKSSQLEQVQKLGLAFCTGTCTHLKQLYGLLGSIVLRHDT